MDININLYADYLDLIHQNIQGLTSQGLRVKSFEQWKLATPNISGKALTEFSDDELREKYKMDLVFAYLDWSQRLVPAKPRGVVFSNEFQCPANHRAGLTALVTKIENGDDLTPHLSRAIDKLNARDGLLFDWGINHFHLGIKPDANRPLMVQGNSEIAYVIITADTVYFLQITDHHHFADKQLFELIAINFPHMIEQFEMKDICPAKVEDEWTGEDLVAARKAGITMIVSLNGKCYIPPGGGFVMSGGSMRSIENLQQTTYWYKKIEDIVKNELPALFGKYPCSALYGISEVNLKMKSHESDHVYIESDNKDFYVQLNINKDGSVNQLGIDLISINK